jgi:hypothetical protein
VWCCRSSCSCRGLWCWCSACPTGECIGWFLWLFPVLKLFCASRCKLAEFEELFVYDSVSVFVFEDHFTLQICYWYQLSIVSWQGQLGRVPVSDVLLPIRGVQERVLPQHRCTARYFDSKGSNAKINCQSWHT